jgi:2,3-bisphosphoglycerate-dependent phosphoglycerate mutase
MAKLYLLRHFNSQWNKENRFTGWVDVPLSAEGKKEVKKIAQILKQKKFDIIYTSSLFRNLDSVARLIEAMGSYPVFRHLDEGLMKERGNFEIIHQNYFPVFVTEKLNERFYGELQGKNKAEVMKEKGKETVQLWRRSYEIPPPQGESLKDVVKRISPFFRKYLQQDLKKGKNVLIVTSHNPLRAIIKLVENISEKEIPRVELPPAALVEYELGDNLKVIKKIVYN